MNQANESLEKNTQSEEKKNSFITLHQHYYCDLQPGFYKFEAEQKVTYAEKKDSFSSLFGKPASRTSQYEQVQKVFLGENRFSLNKQSIKSYYPPKNEYGGLYKFCLPHIVFLDASLPWEWSAKAKWKDDNSLPVPWLALLVFTLDDAQETSRDESIINPVVRTPEDLLKKEDGIFCYPDITELYDHEKNPPAEQTPAEEKQETKKLQTIDIPVALFNKIAPTYEDLPYLAHVRQISTEARSRKSSIFANTNEFYSVLVANRLPKSTKTLVHLVSLIGMGPYLPDTNGVNNKLPSDTKFVRLVSFDSWEFGVNDEARDFEMVVAKTLKAGDPSTLRLPNPSSNSPSSSEAQTIEKALSMGYIAMNHKTRLGDETVSWYRGPLVPYTVPYDVEAKLVKMPSPSADALVRYDSTTGLFDVTYAAAWQLGRLLALRNMEIATDLHDWKIQNNIDTIREFEQQAIERSLPDEVLPFLHNAKSTEEDTTPASLGHALLKALVSQKDRLLDDTLQNELPKMRRTQESSGFPEISGEALREMLNDTSPQTRFLRATSELPQSVKKFLGELELLQGVPYSYLVPDERMLPFESLRFFKLDRNWIECLKDGVLSIGRNNSSILARDTQHLDYFRQVASTISSEYRSNYLNIPNRINARNLLNGEISGFILHSTLVQDFPGMAVQAFSDTELKNPSPLPIFHFETIGNNLTLLLCQGIMEQVRFSLGSEELYYKVDWDEDKQKFFKSPLRNLNNYNPITDKSVDIPFRQGNKGVINIKELANSLSKAVNDSNPNSNRKFTAAEFAFQMIGGPPTVIFWTQTSEKSVVFDSQSVDPSLFLSPDAYGIANQ